MTVGIGRESSPRAEARAPLVPHAPRRRRLASLRTLTALILREMATSYGRSPGSYVWAVLEPVAAIAILSIIFSAAFSSPAIGVNFPLFYATGMLPFQAFSDMSGKVAQALNYSRQLLAYPVITFLDAILARFLLNLLTQLMVGYIVFTGILLIFETRVILDLPTIGLAYALTGALALGVGTLNCYLTTRFPVWQRAWGIAMRPMFILSCIFFVYDSVPEPFRGWLWWNPLVHLVGLMRRGFYPSYDAPYVSITFVLIVSGVTFLAGLLLLRKSFRLLLQN